MDKSLGTVVQFEHFLTHPKFTSTRYLHCTSPPHLQCRKPSRHNFFDLSTLYWVGKGEGLCIFKMIALLFRTVLVMHIELLLCSYCPKDFCPGLQTLSFESSIPHFHTSFNTPCLHPLIFFKFLLSVTVVLKNVQNVCGANKVYYERCAKGEWNPVLFVRSSCY